jgi:malate synthase
VRAAGHASRAQASASSAGALRQQRSSGQLERARWGVSRLREHCAGLNAGRWDYLFSIIKTYRSRGLRYVLPDRSRLTMTAPLMRAYTELLVTTARAEFDAVLGPRPNQLERTRSEVEVRASDLLDFAAAGHEVTLDGVREDVSVALRYVEAWLRGTGAVAIDGLMEDAATAEIARSQLWQWIGNRVVTTSGELIDVGLVHRLRDEVLSALPRSPHDRFDDAAEVLERVALRPEYPAFLTVVAYTGRLGRDGDVEAATSAGAVVPGAVAA